MELRKSDLIESQELVDDVMRRWPVTIRVFLFYRLHCIGCPVGSFHTIEEACAEHEVPLLPVLHDLNAAVEEGEGSAPR